MSLKFEMYVNEESLIKNSRHNSEELVTINGTKNHTEVKSKKSERPKAKTFSSNDAVEVQELERHSLSLAPIKTLDIKLQAVKTEAAASKRRRTERKQIEWTVEETQKLFTLYKELGARWVLISKYLPGHNENDTKNKFYTTLKRVATQAQLEDPTRYGGKLEKCKSNLIQFVDAAMKYGHLLSSKKGRKKNSDKAKARLHRILFPKSSLLSMESESVQDEAELVVPQRVCLVQGGIPFVLVPYYQTSSGLLQPVLNVMIQQKQGDYAVINAINKVYTGLN
eukprot:TRINITY_DN10225_c0_g1_i12.p1 TRINITY_DN10225_c0_g1~~TRINITY_DN10225_c0_g1_i12.p1  ORF type:complete len:281 (+),score=25.54 TRINITY_DN10225_c0_g1_i12:159-1001(+)